MPYRILKCVGLLESAFRAIVNRSRACPPLAGLPAVILVRQFCGGLESWSEFFGEEVVVARKRLRPQIHFTKMGSQKYLFSCAWPH